MEAEKISHQDTAAMPPLFLASSPEIHTPKWEVTAYDFPHGEYYPVSLKPVKKF